MAEQFARRGANRQPPVESGGVILGVLCSCPDTGEFFVVATEVIEVVDAEETSISLMFSGNSWLRIQSVLRARQRNPATRLERIVGHTHGHNAPPGYIIYRKQCAICEAQATCQLTSVFVSEDDLLWTRSVFARQPWAFCLIFGLDARGAGVNGLFGFRGGRLVPRGFYSLDHFPLPLEQTGGPRALADVPEKKETK